VLIQSTQRPYELTLLAIRPVSDICLAGAGRYSTIFITDRTNLYMVVRMTGLWQ
jgi:hypothetical protein